MNLLHVWAAHGGSRLYCKANFQVFQGFLPEVGSTVVSSLFAVFTWKIAEKRL